MESCSQEMASRTHEIKPMNNPALILWIYTILLVIGGVIGFLKAGSKVSLIMSVAFAAALALSLIHIIVIAHFDDILLAALLIVFAMRLSKTKKFMPAGLMLVVTAVALALIHVHF